VQENPRNMPSRQETRTRPPGYSLPASSLGGSQFQEEGAVQHRSDMLLQEQVTNLTHVYDYPYFQTVIYTEMETVVMIISIA